MKYLICLIFAFLTVVFTSCENSASTEKPVQDLKVEMNEKNVLSCRLTFTTLERKKITVRYFSKDHTGYEISEDSEKTAHYFFLWGMYQKSEYTIEIYLDEDFGNPVEVTSFTTGKNPLDTPSTKLRINKTDKVFDGFALFTYWSLSSQSAYSYPIAMAYDNTGRLVWYYEFEDFSNVVFGDLQYVEQSGSIMIGLAKWASLAEIPLPEAIEIDIEGNTLWKSKKIEGAYDDLSSWHHIYEKQPDGSILFLKHEISGSLVYDSIVNIDTNYNELWKWNFFDHITPPEYTGTDWFNWTHANTVNMFKDQGVAYINSRNLSTYYKIDMNSGEIIWKFGKDGDFKMITKHETPWFEFAHDPEPSTPDADTVLFYDNGSIQRASSRIIEYKLNELDMTAEISFEFDGSKINKRWFTEYGGDADRMQNGNIFVTAGAVNLELETKLFEITKEGDIVWEMVFDKNVDWQINIYNAHKIGVDKLLKRL